DYYCQVWDSGSGLF
nr:immunoglobulin light chain junction region [Macaca mulatta]